MTVLAVSSFSLVSSNASEGAVNVDFDASLFVQLGLFVLLLLVLKPLLFDPMMRLFEERENRIEKTVQRARKIDADSAVARQKYEDAMAEANRIGGAEADELRTAANAEDASKLAIVRSEVGATLTAGRAVNAEEATKAKSALDAEIAVLGKAIASKVLGREVSA